MKPLPPYARTATVVSDGLWIRCGQEGWNHLRGNPTCGEIVYPPNATPDKFDWSFVRDLEVWIVRGLSTGNHRVRALADHLMAEGAAMVVVIDWDLYDTGHKGIVSWERTSA